MTNSDSFTTAMSLMHPDTAMPGALTFTRCTPWAWISPLWTYPSIRGKSRTISSSLWLGARAIIPTFENGNAMAEDRDFSHITHKPRAWWHERFLKAGWLQDALHECMHQSAQNHDLARKMGWSVYLYSAGK